MKNWRPENWIGDIASVNNDRDALAKDAFEAGADAMLEALKKQGVYKKMPEVKHYSEIYGAGWLVFIPDEEAKE